MKSYLLFLLVFNLIFYRVGVWSVRSVLGRWSETRVSLMLLAAVVGWFLSSLACRGYAETDWPGWMVAESFAQKGVWFFFAGFGMFFLGFLRKRPGIAQPPSSSLFRVGIPLFLLILTVWKTLPIYILLPEDSTRDEHGFLKQSTESTCAPVALGNLMELGLGRTAPSERELARLARTTTEGTTTLGLLRAARSLGIEVEPPRVIKVEELTAGDHMAIVSISTLPTVKHATLLTALQGDVLLSVDPDYGWYPAPIPWWERVLTGKALVFPQTRLLRAETHERNFGPMDLRKHLSAGR